ncbi:MAG: ABC transporter permease subunit [Caldilineaceae bacterium]|nr:ABC transporter permease subunit [Caldilineaceae bacterium]
MSVESQQPLRSPAVSNTAPAPAAPTPERFHRSALRYVFGILILLLIVNTALPLLLSRTDATVIDPLPTRSEGVVLAAPYGPGQLLVATLDNRVILLDQGQPRQEVQFENLIGGLAVSADGTAIYVGTSDGQVQVLDNTLAVQRTLPVTGRVVGLKAAAEGLVVAYGSGAYSDRYWTSFYASDADKAAYATRAEFTITAMDVTTGSGAVYGTANSRVSRLDDAGNELWKITLTQPPTDIRYLASTDQILVGDGRGNLVLLNGDGATQWAVHLSEYNMRSVYATPAEAESVQLLYLAADSHGDVYIVDEATRLLFTGRATTSDVGALLEQDGVLTLLPRNDVWQTINLEAIAGAGTAATLRMAWAGLNLVFLLALLVALIAAVQRWRRATGQQLRFAWRQRTAYFFILPSMVLILVFSYYPAAMAFYYSFTNFSIRTVTEFIGFENYRRILTSDFYFRVGFLNLGLLLITSLLKTLTMPLLVAELIFRLRNTVHQYVFRTLFVLPAVVPGLISVFLWRMVYDPYAGLLNQVLRIFGLNDWSRAWLGNESTALWAIIGAGFPYISAFPFLIYMGGLLNISTEMYDAAKIDGANWWRQFWNIDVPLLIPQMRLLIFFTLAGTIQGFAQIYIYTRGGPGYATYVPGLQMYYQLAEGDFGYASAIGVLLFIVIFAGTLFSLRFRRQALEAS